MRPLFVKRTRYVLYRRAQSIPWYQDQKPLNNAIAITHVEENNATVISASVDPATNGDRLQRNVLSCTAIMCSHAHSLIYFLAS